MTAAVRDQQLTVVGAVKRTEQNLFVRSSKSEAEVTNNRRLRSTHYTMNTDRYEASRELCDSRATCFIFRG